MIFLVFDLDHTIYHTSNHMDYEKVEYDKELHTLMTFNHPTFIMTNATYAHADKIINQLRLSPHIEKIYSRDTMKYMKPQINSYRNVQRNIELLYKDQTSIFGWDFYYFFDDLLENLKKAKEEGWLTIWIHPKCSGTNYEFVDHAYPNIKEALHNLRIKKILS